MSDFGRKDFTDKASEAIKPDSQKSGLEKAKETATDKLDQLGGSAQPLSEKSYAQQATDAIGGNNSGSISQTAGEYVELAKKYVSEALGGGSK